MKGSDISHTPGYAAAPDAADLLQRESKLRALEKRFVTLSRRLRILRSILAQDALFHQVVGSGRYLKLAQAICCAEEMLEKYGDAFHAEAAEETPSA